MLHAAPITLQPARNTRRLSADDAIKHLPYVRAFAGHGRRSGRAPRQRRLRPRPPSPGSHPLDAKENAVTAPRHPQPAYTKQAATLRPRAPAAADDPGIEERTDRRPGTGGRP